MNWPDMGLYSPTEEQRVAETNRWLLALHKHDKLCL